MICRVLLICGKIYKIFAGVDMRNMVDERFELVSVIFRLAGCENYGHLETDYQKEVAEKFAKFADHPAIKLIKSFDGSNGVWVGYHCTLKFIAHLEQEKKDGKYIFIEDISSLFDTAGNWNETASRDFLKLFNDFYVDTDYAEFYQSKIPYFEEVTKIFVDKTYGAIDFEWFRKYVDPSDLRCIYSLSSGNYGTTVNDKIVYCLVWGNGGAIVHEYCHHLAHKLADKWYNENKEFKKWCEESVNMENMPYYGNGWIMANEYITRAYDILYKVQHGEELEECLSKERDFQFKDSFKYIEEVYNMIVEL